MTIEEEGGVDEASDAIKKIILNFLQIVSLAGGLPLQWPDVIETMFNAMSTLSSAGGALLIPDCELTHLRAADAFYAKQLVYTFVVPIIVVVCIFSWSIIWCTCSRFCRKCPRKFTHVKNYTILSVVLLLFLAYPMLVQLCLSMLKCPKVGGTRYLMADLQEECFQGEHMVHVLALTVPQIILVIIGLPLMGLLLILRTTPRQRLKYNFHMRYGLLYLGYRDERAWWEVIVAIRKICIVMIGTFGILMGRVDIQAFLALGVVFLSIVVHLLGKPFDVDDPKGRLLQNLEFLALCVAWSTFYGGLIFYLLPGEEYKSARVVMTVAIVASNLIFLTYSIYSFVREFIKDFKHKAERRESKRRTALGLSAPGEISRVKAPLPERDVGVVHDSTHIVPVSASVPAGAADNGHLLEKTEDSEDTEDDDDTRFDPEKSKEIRRKSLTHSRSTRIKAHALNDEYHMHELALRARQKKKQLKQRRATQNRLVARLKIRKTKALTRVPMFENVTPEAIESILECTEYAKHQQGHVLCTQHESATDFYIIVSGECAVNVHGDGKNDSVRRVGTLRELDFFGENALLEGARKRNATVITDSEYVQVLVLSRGNFEKLVESKALPADIVMSMTKESERRQEITRRSFMVVKPSPPLAPPPSSSFTASVKVKQTEEV
jgi:CRP-like cAMP-binding protein